MCCYFINFCETNILLDKEGLILQFVGYAISIQFEIMTYVYRKHYPLPLPYAGKTDPEILQETIRRLQAEIRALQSQVVFVCAILLRDGVLKVWNR